MDVNSLSIDVCNISCFVYHKSANFVIQQPIYKYTLVAHPDMRLVPIHRQNSIPTDEDAPPLNFTLYTYPYVHNFPTIVSHAHPRFIICNAGAKLASNLDVHIWSKQGDWLEEMTMINEIWNAWSKVVDQDQPDGRAFVQTKPSNHNISDSDSQHTTRHRERKGLEEQSSPRRNSKQ